MAAAATVSASAIGRSAPGTARARPRAVKVPTPTITVSSSDDHPEAVGVEDRLDHVADRRELHERAQHAIAEVALELGPRQNDTATAIATRTSEAATSPSVTSTVLSRHAPGPRELARPARRAAPPGPRSCVTSTIESPSVRAARRASLDARRGASSSSAEVGSSSSSTSGSSASARASITRCCSPTESRVGVAVGVAGAEPGQLAAAAGVDVTAGERRPVARRCRRRCPAAAPAAAAPAPRAGAGRARRARARRRPSKRTVPAIGIRQPVRAAAAASTCRSRTARDRGRAAADRRLETSLSTVPAAACERRPRPARRACRRGQTAAGASCGYSG